MLPQYGKTGCFRLLECIYNELFVYHRIKPIHFLDSENFQSYCKVSIDLLIP